MNEQIDLKKIDREFTEHLLVFNTFHRLITILTSLYQAFAKGVSEMVMAANREQQRMNIAGETTNDPPERFVDVRNKVT